MSAPPLSPVSPLPMDVYGVTLNAAAPVELPGLFANTVEVQLFNPNAPGGSAVWVAFANVVSSPASFEYTLDLSVPPFVGDTLTLDGEVLTAQGGPYVPGTGTFSVDLRAEATLTVASAPVPVGSVLTLTVIAGPPATTVTLTCVAGPRVPGSDTFEATAGVNAQAAAIAAAINDSSWTAGSQVIRSASDAANVVTLIAGDNVHKRGANGNTSALAPGKFFGLRVTSGTSSIVASDFTGGVNASGGVTNVGAGVNSARDYAQNIARAIVDGSNAALYAKFNGATAPLTGAALTRRIRVFATTLGVAGNGLVVTSSNPAAIAVTSPTAGGVTRPVALSATTALIIPPQGRVVLPVGREGQRNPVQPSTYWTTMQGANIGLLGQVETAGAATTLNVAYVNAV